MPQLAWSQVFLNEDADKGKRKADPAGVQLGISTERWCRSSKRSILLRQIAENEGEKAQFAPNLTRIVQVVVQ